MKETNKKKIFKKVLHESYKGGIFNVSHESNRIKGGVTHANYKS